MSNDSKNKDQRLRDRKQPEYTQAKGHNKRVRDLYPEAWADSTINDYELSAWIKQNKSLPCPYCGQKVKEVDHKLPLSKGGAHAFDNLEMLCMPCNRAKSDMNVEEFKEFKVLNPTPQTYKPDPELLRPQGRYRTKSLLKGSEAVWDLQQFKQLYLDFGDPTEYRFAIAYLGSWKHWKLLTKQRFLVRWLQEVREELKVRIRSQAVEKLLQTDNLAGIKLLATEDIDFLNPTTINPVGRPRKEEQVSLIPEQDINEDLTRIMN